MIKKLKAEQEQRARRWRTIKETKKKKKEQEGDDDEISFDSGGKEDGAAFILKAVNAFSLEVIRILVIPS